jgi:hypothetical protein
MINQVGRICIRGKYLRIKGDAHELLCNILTLLLGEFRSAGLKKEENRGEEKFRAFNKIIFFCDISGKSLIILFIFILRMFWFSRFSSSRIRF